jgi:outer membrane immunogenic protein
MLRNLLLATAAVIATAAVAAPATAAPATPAAAWGGFYAGVNAGFGGDKFVYPANATYTNGMSVTTLNAQGSQTSSGFLGGAQIGYNLPVSNSWIVGLEADIDASGIEGQTHLSGGGFNTSGSLGAAGDITSKLNYLGTVRVRVGYPMFDSRFMPFVTGGLAYGEAKTSADVGYTSSGGASGSVGVSRTSTRTGWTAGVGADYALTDNMSFRAEYLYADLGKSTLYAGSFGVGGGTVAGSLGLKTTANIVRVGMDWRFGG